MGIDGPSYNTDSNISPELKTFLSDNLLDSDEAKALNDIFEVNKNNVIHYTKDDLSDLRLVLSKYEGYEEVKKGSFIGSNEKDFIRKIGNKEVSYKNTNEESDSFLVEEQLPTNEKKPTVKKQYQEKFNTASDTGIDSGDEKVYSEGEIYKEGTSLRKTDVYYLQLLIGFKLGSGTGLDGGFGPNTFKKYKEFNNNWNKESIKDFLDRNKIFDRELESDKKLKGKEDFDSKYGDVVLSLQSTLGLPSGTIRSIIRKESSFGVKLDSGTGSKGIMQLTYWPFKDMLGYNPDLNIDKSKIISYKKMFDKIETDKFKGVIDGEILLKIKNLQDNTLVDNVDIENFRKTIKEFYFLLKLNPDYYNHGLNMIIGSIYFKRLLDLNGGDIKKAAINYNGDDNIYRDRGETKKHKYYYGEDVSNYQRYYMTKENKK